MKALVEHIRQEFIIRFGKHTLTIASPGRINLIGEHTDYNDGFVFPASIDKYVVSVFSISDKEYTSIYALDMGECLKVNLNNISKEEENSWRNYVLGVMKEIQLLGGVLGNFNLVFGGNVPEGAGLSSSAALENSIVFGLNELFNLGFSKEEMVQISMKAEHNFADVQCGIMDQFASINGRKGKALMLDCRSLTYESVPINLKNLELVLINSNVKHSLVHSAYNTRKEECKIGLTEIRKSFKEVTSLRDVTRNQLQKSKPFLQPNIYNRCLFVVEENDRVHKAKNAIETNDWSVFGQQLFASHQGLKDLYEVSCKELDFMVDLAKKSSAVLGSRMIGGGFGGCTLNLIKKEEVKAFTDEVREKYLELFNKNIEVYPVRIADGTRIISE